MSSVISALQNSMARYEREEITDEELRVEILNALHGGIDQIQDKQEKEYVFGILGLLLDKGVVEPKVVQDIRDYLVPPAEQDISMEVPGGKVRVRTALKESWNVAKDYPFYYLGAYLIIVLCQLLIQGIAGVIAQTSIALSIVVSLALVPVFAMFYLGMNRISLSFARGIRPPMLNSLFQFNLREIIHYSAAYLLLWIVMATFLLLLMGPTGFFTAISDSSSYGSDLSDYAATGMLVFALGFLVLAVVGQFFMFYPYFVINEKANFFVALKKSFHFGLRNMKVIFLFLLTTIGFLVAVSLLFGIFIGIIGVTAMDDATVALSAGMGMFVIGIAFFWFFIPLIYVGHASLYVQDKAVSKKLD